jgi:uncharacterized membrane protein
VDENKVTQAGGREARKMLVEAIKQQRVSLACAVTVGIFLIFVFHAPLAPVAVGCLFSLVYLFIRGWTKLSSGKGQRR